MKNILIFTNDNFIKKNFIEYVEKNNLNYKLFFFSDLKNINSFKIKKLVKKNLFTVISVGLSGSIKFNIENGPKIFKNNTKLYYNLLTKLENHSFRNVFFVSASCAYPTNHKILNEKYFGFPPLELTSYFYSLSKIFATNICRQINRNKKFNYITLVPATLYGKYSKYHKINSHVLIALTNKIKRTKKKVILWGSGKPKREFIYIQDFIDAIFFIHKNGIKKDIINVGTGYDLSVKNLANKIKRLVNYKGKIVWDHTKKDGTFKKLLDSSFLFDKGWKPLKNLNEGIKEIIN